MAFVEANRYLSLTTPLGENKLLLDRFNGHEGLSQLFHFELELLAENSTAVDFEKLIGQKVSFGVQGMDPQQKTPRFFSGIVIEFSQGGRDPELTSYRATIVPEVWKLTRKFRSRIFQQRDIVDVLQNEVFKGYAVSWKIEGTFEPREYITQYQESDFAFACRLMEEEGIFYFFTFTKDGHQLVLANTPPRHPDIPAKKELTFGLVPGGNQDEQRITAWQKEQSWGSGKYTLWDHSFELPHRHLDATQTVVDTVQLGKVSHKLKLSGNEDLEILEHPGGYSWRFDGVDKGGSPQPDKLQKIFQDNKRTAGIRMQQTETPMLLVQGASNCRQITPGHKFSLQGHFNGDGQYVILEVSHQGAEGGFRSENRHAEEAAYQNAFTCIPYALPYRPPRVTARPSIPSPLTAVVVGPAGEEIHTEQYGRVKVKFMWDPAADTADNTCWARVATSWAGATWGSIHIPRIGQEVVVSFLNGDPDRPLVTGSVYNPDQMPPYKLPDHKTVSTIKSRSTMQGGKTNFNELRFEDLKGKEQVFLHAERDKDQRTKAESREWVGANRHLFIKQNQKESIGKNKHITVGGDHVQQTGGDQHLTVTGNVLESIGGAHSATVSGDQKEQIGGKLSVTVGGSTEQSSGTKFAHQAGQEIHLKSGMKVIIEAGVELTLIGPGGFIDINPAGVTIQGTIVLINSGGSAGSGSGSSPSSPGSPKSPDAPDVADDGTKFDKV
jgi:type VI secretion system secreted protein VgrG